MRIASVRTLRVDYPVKGRFKFFDPPRGGAPSRPTVVVRLESDGGVVGWGQAVPSPRWSYETPETVESTIALYLAPELLGRDPLEIEALHAAMNRAIAPSFSTGQPIAKAGVDLALTDLAGRALGRCLTERWGRRGRGEIELSWTLNPRGPDEVPAEIEEARRRGYRSFNVKVAPDPRADLEICALVRRLAPDAFLWADANGGYEPASAEKAARGLAELGFAALEQPLPANRLGGFRRLRELGAIPILMDEPIVSRADLEEFLELGLLDGVAMKVARCGGLTESRRILDLMEAAGLLFFGSGLTDPDLSLAATLALFGAYDLARPAALNGPQYLVGSVLRKPLEAAGGRLAVPEGPGLGVEVDEARLQESGSWHGPPPTGRGS